MKGERGEAMVLEIRDWSEGRSMNMCIIIWFYVEVEMPKLAACWQQSGLNYSLLPPDGRRRLVFH